ncbi:Importin 9 [Desmophyllum pertusum]|uniref:Importin 9 n=1 Tax=Desmophyllum pertusum TaxID=174260 RepID=A0A9W9YCC8_9CNID|nr:Importin 9 [Desmophyllum pertusum]
MADGNNLGDNLDLLLRGVLSKLQQAETLSIIQSLVVSFLHLMNSQLQMTLEFLSSVPDPTGKSALEYVVRIWCARQPEFFGVYDSKVSSSLTLAIKDSQVLLLKARGFFNHDEGPEQWTMIPVPVKLFKLIINELGTLLESATAGDEHEDGDSERCKHPSSYHFVSDTGSKGGRRGGLMGEEGWEDVDDDEEAIDVSGSPFAPASDYLGFDAEDFEDEDEDDPEIKNDPIYVLDLQNHLIKFVQTFAQQQCYPSYFQALNAQERHTLSKIGIPS